MFKCLFCGLDHPSEKARFCIECGPDGPAKDWTSEGIDQPQKVDQYVSMLSEFYFDAPNNSSVDKFSLRIRERLKISYDTHVSVLSKLAKQKQAIAHLANFRFEFNENVIDAYAGHDTFLNFRYTNLSEDDLFKVSLFWDDPNTTQRIDLKAETKNYVKPLTSVMIGASVIFDRIGIKELSDFQITIADQFGESASFRAEPFSFKVGNHDQKITQTISTHNQISIEGRGVVDASGMGAEQSASQSGTSNQPRWRELGFSYLPQIIEQSSPAQKVDPEPEVQQRVETETPAKGTVVEFDENNHLSVLQAAERGDPEAQITIGNMYLEGYGVAQSNERAVNWYRKAAEQGYAQGQINLGHMYKNGHGVAKDDEIAARWFRMAAEQGDADAQFIIAVMYFDGVGVAKNDEKAAEWYRKCAEQGDANAQYQLGALYFDGIGVAKNDEIAARWFRMAAEQGDADAQYEIGLCYSGGLGVTQNDEKAADWIRKAAEQGNAEAQYQLGFFYLHGEGVVKNTDKANEWFRKSAEQGDADAIEYLQSINSTSSSTIDEFLNDEDDTTSDIDEDIDNVIRIDYEDGSNYIGRVEDGQPEGFGTMTFANGDSMYGMFVNGIMNDDTGHYDFADGGTYDGPIVGGTFHGLGTLTFGGEYVGHRYTGNFENGYFSGQGTYIFPDGSTNVGLFKDGKFVPPSSGVLESNYADEMKNSMPYKSIEFSSIFYDAKLVEAKNITPSIIKASQADQFEDNIFNSVDDIILFYANKRISSLDGHFFINNGPKFNKKIKNFSESFSKNSVLFDQESNKALLFYDATILGSGKKGIVFTSNYLYAKGCMKSPVETITISYSDILSVRMINPIKEERDPANQEICIESSGHGLEPIFEFYCQYEDVMAIVEMLNGIRNFIK